MRLGAYNLTDKNERGVIERNVAEIFIHPDWDVYDNKFDADIAILLLSENITFTYDIQPVCIPGDGVIENIIGTVVGWGLMENTSYAEIPRQTSIKAISDAHCFRTDIGIAAYTSARTFCGGEGDGTPNSGDSGGGFFVISGSVWIQYGIVSAIRTNATGHLIENSFALYTNLTAFKNWTIETVSQSGGEVGEAMMNIDLYCSYDHSVTENLYGCWLNNIDIQRNNVQVVSFSGSHSLGETNQDVQLIQFVNGTMFFIPNGLGNLFRNINYLIVGDSESRSLGTKRIRRSNFQNLENLLELIFHNNDIEILNEDSLWDLPKLRVFKFVNNKLKVLSEKTFFKNDNLKEVYLNSNELKYLPRNVFLHNSLLEKVDFRNNFLKTIDERIFETNLKLIGVSFVSNQLEVLPRILFKNNLLLTLVDFKNNSLSSIDEDLFETNVKLTAASLALNQFKSLPRNLFINNLLLNIVDFRNNSLTILDEKLFERNTKLRTVSLASNRLEFVQINLLKNNLLLEWVDLFNNDLKVIEIDFTVFENIRHIDLNANDCMNAKYIKNNSNPTPYTNNLRNLMEFQNLIRTNCSSNS